MARKTVHDLIIKLGGDAKEFEHLIRSSKQKTKGFKDQFMDLKKAIAGAFAVREIVQFAGTAIEAYDRQIKAENKLLLALDNRQGAQKRLINQAAELQQNSTFGDEQIIEQQAFLASLGMTESQIKKLIPAAMDLSAALGQSLEFGVRNLAKTYSGLTGELGELVPELKNFTAEELKAGAAVEYATSQFAGQAKLMSESGIGVVQKFKNEWGDFTELLGEKLAPGMIFITGLLRTMLGLMGEESNGAIQEFDKYAERINNLPTGKQKEAWEEIQKLTLEAAAEMAGVQDQYRQGMLKLRGQARKDAEEEYQEINKKTTYLEDLLDMIDEQVLSYQKLPPVIKAATVELSKFNETFMEQETRRIFGGPTDYSFWTNLAKNLPEDPLKSIDDLDEEMFPEDDKFYEQLNEKYGKLKDFSDAVKELITGALTDSFMTFGDLFEDIFSGEANAMDNFFSSILGKMGDFAKQMGALFMTYGIAQMEFFTSWKEGPAGAAKLIAAGAALIAVGGAIKGLAKAQTGNSAGGYNTGPSNAGSFTTGNYGQGSTVLRGETIKVATLRNTGGIRGRGLRYQ
jgi:hypothetical protein